MTAQAARKDEPEIELSCREAQLLLRTISLFDEVDNLNYVFLEQRAAAKHCSVECDECIKKGFEKILEVEPLSCREALEIWSSMDIKSRLSGFPGGQAETLYQKLALEHIFGRQLLKDKEDPNPGQSRHFFNRFEMCNKKACDGAYHLVKSESSPVQDVYRVYHAFLLELFFREGWNIKGILDGLWEVYPEKDDVFQKQSFDQARILVEWLAEHRNVSQETPFAELVIKLEKGILKDAPWCMEEFVKSRRTDKSPERFAYIFDSQQEPLTVI
ncbi:MAG TPA: hypothetical protein VJB70_03380 [Candidatus Paceibacterota bacterium]